MRLAVGTSQAQRLLPAVRAYAGATVRMLQAIPATPPAVAVTLAATAGDYCARLSSLEKACRSGDRSHVHLSTHAPAGIGVKRRSENTLETVRSAEAKLPLSSVAPFCASAARGLVQV